MGRDAGKIIIYGAFTDKEMLLRYICFKQYFWRPFSSLAWRWWQRGGRRGGGLVWGVWYFVYICGRWNEGGGKIAPSQIITAGGGGFQKSQRVKI